jgi:Lon protease-like protein
MNVTFDNLALFPLPLVLFPGMALPLHIFEPRYRQMLADSLSGERRFGIIRLPEGMVERDLPPGTIGCVAEIVNTEMLGDGRSNIIVRGAERFSLLALIETERPYHVCSAQLVADDFEIGTELDAVMTSVGDMFRRVARAARTLADDPDPVPELPEDAASLSFAIAAMIDISLDERQQLLASRSPLERLRHLQRVLSTALGVMATRAEVHTLAKTNGRGAHVQP